MACDVSCAVDSIDPAGPANNAVVGCRAAACGNDCEGAFRLSMGGLNVVSEPSVDILTYAGKPVLTCLQFFLKLVSAIPVITKVTTGGAPCTVVDSKDKNYDCGCTQNVRLPSLRSLPFFYILTVPISSGRQPHCECVFHLWRSYHHCMGHRCIYGQRLLILNSFVQDSLRITR